MEEEKYLTVSALTRYIKYKFDTDPNLKTVFLKGEISNFKSHSTGHLYFSIKDETSKINAIMFSSSAKRIDFIPMDGTKVLIIGRISVYEATGNYQIYVDQMMEDGVGNLYIAFEKLKKKLESEGLFDDHHKKAIPKVPNRIGIVTAQTGAAVKDILSTIGRRYPVVETILFPCLVQGERAAEDIVRNIKLAEAYQIDTLIVGRGGGSIEDLWPFNEEIVARAIYDCSIPVISAVGHEIDYTIVDFVADLRAPTPTGAAEIAVPNLMDLKQMLDQRHIRLDGAIYQKINYTKLQLDSIQNSFVLKNPMLMFDRYKQKLDYLCEEIIKKMTFHLHQNQVRLEQIKHNYLLTHPKELYEKKKIALKTIVEKLVLLNPLDTLKRGYTLTLQKEHVITSAKKIKVNDTIQVRFSDGTIHATVVGKE